MYPTLRNPMIVSSLLIAFCADAIACVNLPPVADVGNPNPTWVHIGYQLCFDGEPSYDDDEIVSYRWRFGDGATTGWKSGRPHNCDPYDPYRTKHAYSSVGNRIAILDVKDRQGLTASDSFFVYVCSMSWSADSYVIPVNDDDDDEDGVMDNRGGALPGDDDDLVPMLISDNSPRGQPDVVSLGIIHDTGALQVWDQRARTGRLIGNMDLSETWPAAANWSETVYVEGMHASSGQELSDPKLRWDYFGHIYAGEYLSHPLYGWSKETDLSQKRWTVVHVDMDMPTVADDWTTGGDAMTQETKPGGFIQLNDYVNLKVRPVLPDLSWPGMTLSVEYTGTGQIEIWDATPQKKDLPYPISPTSDLSLWVKGTAVSSSPRDITLVLTHNATGFQDRIRLTVVDVDVLGVPQYLFASASYATPIKFQIKGLGSQVFIHDVQADFYIDDTYQWTSLMGMRFTAGVGTIRGNGTTDTYTCYVPAAFYEVFNLGSAHRTDNARFVVWVSCSTDGVAPVVDIKSELTDPQSAPAMFFDPYIFAVEPGIPGVHPGGIRIYSGVSITSGTQAEVGESPRASYQHILRSSGLGGYCDPSVWPVPHDEPEEMEDLPNGRAGMNYMWGMYNDTHEASVTPGAMCISTRLYDDSDWLHTDPLPPFDQGCKARVYGYRRGGYFCVSYGGRQLAAGILGTNPPEYAMDLSKTSGNFDWQMFNSAHVDFTNVQNVSGGLNVTGAASSAFGIASLVTSEAPPVSLVFGVIGEIFNLVDSVDLDSPDTDRKAEGGLYRVLVRHRVAGDPIAETKEPIHRDYSGTASVGANCNYNGKSCNAGDQWTSYAEIESVVSAQSRPYNSVDVQQRTEYKCDVSADFTTMTIQISE